MALDRIIDQNKADNSDALFSVVNILKTKAPTGFEDSAFGFEGEKSTNIMDVIGFVKNEVPGGSSIIDIAHTISPAADPVEIVKGKLVGSPTIKAFIDALAPANSESELGGDALGAMVGHLKRIPLTEPVISTFVSTFVVDSAGNAGPIKPVTDLLHEISLGGHLLKGTVPAGTTFSSEEVDGRTGEDSLDKVVQLFNHATGTDGAIIPGIFPKMLGDDAMAIAGIAHDVLPAYTTFNGLLDTDTGIIGSMIPAGGLGDLGGLGGLGGLGDLTDVLDLGGANPLDSLLGGLDLLGGLTGSSASAEASAESSNGGILAILDLGNGGLAGGLGGALDLGL
ncbi:hypothetical protein THMIRHAS_20740 [Thiosulfatimonas sediminis]|uniref:Uncharacterized protein n=1 Tax=Thiosulfatimonas sediminis TaxID=2675054 RepID=A0A6F8PX49_9GAMM|nr:hypothetical protein [Thiosulfatimonas sediminis]BBP46701.1 hypothetical protein THMIRHAS_20740 [Thiosulfatimonas sediminis]